LALLLGHLSIVQLYMVVFVEGTLALFYNLANAASLPRIVGRNQLADASARQQVSFSSGSVLGPALYGLLAGLGGVALPFVVDAVSYLVSLLSLAFVRRSLQETREHAPRPMVQEVREGVLWLWQHPIVRFLALLVGGLNLASGGFALIVLVIAQNGGASEFEIGLIFAAGGLGALVGAFLIGPLRRRFAVGPLLVGATWVWALTWLPYAVVTTPLALATANMVGFVVVSIHNSVQYSYRLGQIPDRLQGRVNAVFRLLLFGSMSLGVALTGLLLQALGPVPTVLITFVPQLALAIVATLHRPFRTASE
jgi:predicted MFS family arabinose efflux permease